MSNELRFIKYLIVVIMWSGVYAHDDHDRHGVSCSPISVDVKMTSQLAARAIRRSGLKGRTNHHNVERRNKKGTKKQRFALVKQAKAEHWLDDTKKYKTFRTPPAQTVGFNFTAATIANVQDGLIIPPNPSGAVGPTQYILMSYNVIRSFDKTTGLPDGVLEIDAASFFGVSANDVRIEYDPFIERWIMSCEGTNDTTGQVADLVLAVSHDSVIGSCTLWDFYTFSNAFIIPQLRPLGTGDLDYQQLALDQNAVYISADTFDQLGTFRGTSLLVIKKSSLVAGPIVAKVFHGIVPGSDPNLAEFSPPADNFDANPTFGYLIHTSNDVFPSGNTYNKLYLYRVLNPESSNPSLGNLVTITVPVYTDAANAPYKGNLFGSAAFLQTSGSILSAPHVRNHQLFVCQNLQVDRTGVANPHGNRVGVRWYQFDMTGDATGQGLGVETENTVPVLIQHGTLFDSTVTSAPKFYYIPSMMTNQNGDMVIGCTVSGDQDYPNALYTGRKAADALGTLRTPVLVTSSTNSYNFGPFVDPANGNIGQRWGDLSSVSLDPSNNLDMWSTQEFAAVQNGWGVQVTQLLPA